MFFLQILIFGILFGLSGCASLNSSGGFDKKIDENYYVLTKKDDAIQKIIAGENVDKQEQKIKQKNGSNTVGANGIGVNKENKNSNNVQIGKVHIPTKMALKHDKKLYNFWINYFTKREKERFVRHVQNGDKYRNLVFKIFKEHGLPQDLFYVGLIEGGYNSHIRSSANAVGPWQFIRRTATGYGLMVNPRVDERRNIFKATHAAARYFKDLYNIFGSWELALCAYNAGEYRIINAIRRGNTRDYQTLVDKKLLPKETVYYIPKVAAARDISNNRKMYQFPLEDTVQARVYNEAIAMSVDSNFDMLKVAQKLQVSYSILKKLNPDLKQRLVHASKKHPFVLYVPDKLERKIASIGFKKSVLANNEDRSYRREVGKRHRRKVVKTYRVRKGDNLSSIAMKFNTTVIRLKRLNGLRSSKLYVGTKLRVSGTRRIVYVVKKGDNLTDIASNFGVPIHKIKRLNSLKGNTIFPNQKLYITET